MVEARVEQDVVQIHRNERFKKGIRLGADEGAWWVSGRSRVNAGTVTRRALDVRDEKATTGGVRKDSEST